jgi:ribosome-associated heat shock protein Hsp15
MARGDGDEQSVRLDKWLWAARFFKTRSLAKQAVEGGRVQLDGKRVKPARPIHPGEVLDIRRSQDRLEVTVQQLSSKRGPAKVAQTLYVESAASMEAREQRREQAKLERAVAMDPGGRPSKKDRRRIKQFKGANHTLE